MNLQVVWVGLVQYGIPVQQAPHITVWFRFCYPGSRQAETKEKLPQSIEIAENNPKPPKPPMPLNPKI